MSRDNLSNDLKLNSVMGVDNPSHDSIHPLTSAGLLVRQVSRHGQPGVGLRRRPQARRTRFAKCSDENAVLHFVKLNSR